MRWRGGPLGQHVNPLLGELSVREHGEMARERHALADQGAGACGSRLDSADVAAVDLHRLRGSPVGGSELAALVFAHLFVVGFQLSERVHPAGRRAT